MIEEGWIWYDDDNDYCHDDDFDDDDYYHDDDFDDDDVDFSSFYHGKLKELMMVEEGCIGYSEQA